MEQLFVFLFLINDAVVEVDFHLRHVGRVEQQLRDRNDAVVAEVVDLIPAADHVLDGNDGLHKHVAARDGLIDRMDRDERLEVVKRRVDRESVFALHRQNELADVADAPSRVRIEVAVKRHEHLGERERVRV